MHRGFTHLNHIEELEQLLSESTTRPLLLFKHSYSCGISAEALDELVDHLNDPPLDVRYAMVTVQTHRDVSNAVTATLGVRHETPQVLLVHEGRVVWSASHFRVTADAVHAAVTAAGARAPVGR
jgi:bacillithiol system protein YtxJ